MNCVQKYTFRFDSAQSFVHLFRVSCDDEHQSPADPPDFSEHLVSHPHDAFVKQTLSDPKRAASLFRSMLPGEISDTVDWESLNLLPTTFVDSVLRETRADLLFSARCRDQREIRFYLLLEHQSTVFQAMGLRMLGYACNIYQDQLKQHGLPLIPVIPFVLHQGPDTWDVSTRFEDLFAIPAGLEQTLLPYLPKFHYALNDLTRFEPESMAHDQAVQTILLLMKLARQRDVGTFLVWLVQTHTGVLTSWLIEKILSYCMHIEAPLDMPQIQMILQSNPHLKAQAMTLAEKLRTEGMEKGMQQGMQKGLEKGRLNAMRRSVLDVLSLRFDRVPEGLREHILSITDADQLERLLVVAIKAASLEEFSAHR